MTGPRARTRDLKSSARYDTFFLPPPPEFFFFFILLFDIYDGLSACVRLRFCQGCFCLSVCKPTLALTIKKW